MVGRPMHAAGACGDRERPRISRPRPWHELRRGQGPKSTRVSGTCSRKELAHGVDVGPSESGGDVCWGHLTRVVVTEIGGKVSYERWFAEGAVAAAAIF